MEEHDKRFWRNMTFAQLRNRRVRVSAYGGDMILEFRLTPGIGHTLGARQYTVNGFDIGELFHEGHDGFMELTRQKAPVSIKLLPDEPEYKIIEDITGVQPGDVFVQTNGNKYPVQEITDDGHCLVLIDSNTYRIDDDAFDHALRPAPARIPDCPGLWEDKSDGLYTVWKNGQELWIMQIRESDGRWMNGPALLIGKTGENATIQRQRICPRKLHSDSMMKNCEGRECNPSPTFSTNCVSLRLFLDHCTRDG